MKCAGWGPKCFMKVVMLSMLPGHAHREELRDMLYAARPEILFPCMGEYQHLVSHGRLAEECGVGTENVIRLENGQPLTILENGFRLEQPIPVDYTLVDGKGVGDVGATVLQGKTRILGEEGVVVVSLVLDEQTGDVLDGPGDNFSRIRFRGAVEPYSGRCPGTLC